jgi:hypothetical protein
MEPRKMMGFETPNDQRVPVSVRDWTAMKLAIWKSRYALEIVARAASAILARCKHEEGCPGATVETEPCFAGCPDREMRMDALVALNAARMFTPVDAHQPMEPYFAPSRERYSETISQLGAAEVERDALREMLRSMGVESPTPPENAEPARLDRKPVKQFTEEDLEEEITSSDDSAEEGILGQ